MRVLFLSHEADRTGAPLVLLTFVRWIRSNTNIEPLVLLARDVGLRRAFESAAPTWVFGEQPPGVRRSLIGRVLRRLGVAHQRDYSRSRLESVFRPGEIDLVYSNTVANGRLLEELCYLNCPVLTHVHELDSAIQHLGVDNMRAVFDCSNHYIAVSGAVRRNLVNSHGVSASKIDLVNEFVSEATHTLDNEKVARLRRSGGSGFRYVRKGKDFFLQTALAFRRAASDVDAKFLWVGGDPDDEMESVFLSDLHAMGLDEWVIYVPQVENPLDYYSLFDVFLMTSREDPYPLVNIEAASLGIPIICFLDTGGSQEFISNGCGIAVPYGDASAMASTAAALCQDRERREHMGELAKARAREHDVSVLSPRIVEILEKMALSAVDAAPREVEF